MNVLYGYVSVSILIDRQIIIIIITSFWIIISVKRLELSCKCSSMYIFSRVMRYYERQDAKHVDNQIIFT